MVFWKKEEQVILTCQDPVNRGVSGQTRLSTLMKNPSIRQVLWQQETPRMENKSVRNTASPLRPWAMHCTVVMPLLNTQALPGDKTPKGWCRHASVPRGSVPWSVSIVPLRHKTKQNHIILIPYCKVTLRSFLIFTPFIGLVHRWLWQRFSWDSKKQQGQLLNSNHPLEARSDRSALVLSFLYIIQKNFIAETYRKLKLRNRRTPVIYKLKH